MSVIIRLQNLPWSANALDIRQYFQGLSIPEGGVHIVGGEQGDAFIAFSTDEDARQAMMADGGKIKEVKLKLFLSSRAEMQKVIEAARQQTIALQDFMQVPQQQPTPQQPALPQIQAPQHPQHPTHLLGAAGVISQLHLQQAATQLGLHHQLSSQPPQQAPVLQQPAFPEKSVSGVTEKKDTSERSRGDNRRNRSRTRSRDRDSSHRRNSRDKDRDRYRRRGGRSRSRSRDRRRRDRSRDRSKSRDRGRDRSRRSDKDNGKDNSKDNKDKSSNNDVVVVGQFQGRSNSKIQTGNSSIGQREQKVAAPNINGSLTQAVSVPPPTVNWLPAGAIPTASDNSSKSILSAQPNLRPPNNALLQNPNTAPSVTSNRIPNNFPPEEVRGFPAPLGPDQQGWMPPRQPGMYPQRMYGDDGPPQGRGGFRGGPPGRPGRSTRFESMDGRGPPDFPPADGPFPHPRGRGDRFQPYDDNFRGGHRPFNNRDNPPRRLAPHTCIEIRNMPSTATYRDVRDFFQGMHVFNIKIINDDQGRRTGVSYVRFMNIENKEAALSMNGMSLHGVPLEMTHLDDNIYEEAVDAFTPNNDAIVVALHGLPRYANEQDIRRLFPGARLLDIIVQQSSNPHAPQAFVHFSTVHEGKRALGASGKLTVDGKEIFVERSNIDILMNAKKMMQEVGQDGQAADEEVKEKIVPTRRDSTPLTSDCVLLQGLPTNANDREILDFFSDVGLVPLRIHVMLDGASTPSGDAFCEFSSSAEGARAMAKNKNMLGSNEVIVRVVPRREMEDALGILEQKRHEEKITVQRPNGPVGAMPGPRNGPMPPEHMRGHMPGPMRGGHMPRGDFRGRGRGGHFDMRGGAFMRGHRGHGHHGGPPMMSRPPMAPEGHARESPTVDNFGKPGCVIEMQNVPYKAEIEEIIDYFDGFDVTRPNVIRRYNENGMPTGDARVALRSPQEAQRAIQELKFKQMRDRQVYLNII